MRDAFKEAILGQFRGRNVFWILAFVVSSLVVLAQFFLNKPTCDLLFHPGKVAATYALAWLWLFLFIGVTARAKLLFAIGLMAWLSTKPLVQYRMPTNERRTLWRLNEMQRTLHSTPTPAKTLSDIIGPELAKNESLSGYKISYSSELQNGLLKHYVITARPECYCRTGLRSFRLDDSGTIHYTEQDRIASASDPVLRQD